MNSKDESRPDFDNYYFVWRAEEANFYFGQQVKVVIYPPSGWWCTTTCEREISALGINKTSMREDFGLRPASSPTPTPTPTPTNTLTPTFTLTPTPPPGATPTPTLTPTVIPSPTPSPTPTLIIWPTSTPTPTPVGPWDPYCNWRGE